jgi:hypothetical protein
MVWVMLRSVTYCGYDVNISFVVGLKEWNTLAEKEGEAALLDQADEQWESLAAGNP